MPIRIASLNRQIEKNGARLHQAMLNRVHSRGVEHETSEIETALLEERRLLKETQTRRQAQGKLPRHKPALVRTTKPPKAPKAKKEPKEHAESKAPKAVAKGAKPSRADKVARKAEALEAAKKAAKKSAKT